MRLAVYAIAGGLVAGQAAASDLVVTVEIPRLTVSEYHRPYVAVWLESADQKVTNLAVWYDLNLKGGEGTKWLKDMRQWWRRTGRDLAMPVDGLSGATRPPGKHQITLPTDRGPLASLPAGQYSLIVEAAREVGGREVLKIPFQWPPSPGAAGAAKGEAELTAIALELKP